MCIDRYLQFISWWLSSVSKVYLYIIMCVLTTYCTVEFVNLSSKLKFIM